VNVRLSIIVYPTMPNAQKRRLEKKFLSNGNGKQLLPKSYEQKCQLVTHLTNHAAHILETLSIKHHSLSIEIDAFLVVCRESFCVSLLLDSPSDILLLFLERVIQVAIIFHFEKWCKTS
jgi:hypothetical protein